MKGVRKNMEEQDTIMLRELGIEDISDLFGYEPHESEYARYAADKPYLIATAHKLQDVYETLSRARAFLWYLSNEEWGDFANKSDAVSLLFLKSQLLQSALYLYGSTLDMIWQMVWAHIQPASLDYILDLKYMEQYKNCDRDNILAQLKCDIARGGSGAQTAERIKDIFEAFDQLPITIEMRSIYNYVKHHGTLRFEGLGSNPQTLNVTVNSQSVNVLHRKITSIESLKATLLDYDRAYVQYIRQLVSLFIPEDYKQASMPATEFIAGILKCMR